MPKYNVARLQEFFFEASLQTYAGGFEATRIAEQPRKRRFVRQQDELTYIDEYWIGEDGWSSGNTVILVREVPAWQMFYGGQAKEHGIVLDFLKWALRIGYTRKEWNGGRGPRELKGNGLAEGLVYENFSPIPPYDQSFLDFHGRERIWRKPAREVDVFWHEHQGLLLGEAE